MMTTIRMIMRMMMMISFPQCVSGTDSWQRVNTEIPVKSPRFALFDLAEGKSYSFRVRCCNSAGVGEPSDPTEATTVGDKLGQRTRINSLLLLSMKSVAAANTKAMGSGRQISRRLLAELSPPGTRTPLWSCPGRHLWTPRSWWATTSRLVWWAAMSGSRATTSR